MNLGDCALGCLRHVWRENQVCDNCGESRGSAAGRLQDVSDLLTDALAVIHSEICSNVTEWADSTAKHYGACGAIRTEALALGLRP